jgi:hypothetical protein
MARNSFASSAHAKRRAKNAKPIPDSQLDLSDIPESTAAELRRARPSAAPPPATPNNSSPSASPQNFSASSAAWPPNNPSPTKP